jgi:CubicO group peptidase (beta-lactamase class C family)
MPPRTAVRQLAAIGLAGAGACAAPRDRVPAPLPSCGEAPCSWTTVARTVDSAVNDGAAPGAVVAVSVGGARFYHGAGHLGQSLPDEPGSRTMYDLASLTKVVALTTLCMMAVDEGKLSLDRSVARYLPEFAGGPKDQVTIRHLLTHSSGLRAHRSLWQEVPTADSAVSLVVHTPLDTVPGARMVYSDLGAIVLTKVIERIYRRPFDQLVHDRLTAPLGLRETIYRPAAQWRHRIAPTENDPWRGRVLWGEVHDENAAMLGGISGHAGLFSDAEDLLTFGEWLLRRYGDSLSRPPSPVSGPWVSQATVREFTRRQDVVPGSSRALGWDTPSPGSSAGTRLSDLSFGHTGFTGTSIWIDPTRSLVIVLLSNRVHPSRENPRLGPLRAIVADRVVSTLDGELR